MQCEQLRRPWDEICPRVDNITSPRFPGLIHKITWITVNEDLHLEHLQYINGWRWSVMAPATEFQSECSQHPDNEDNWCEVWVRSSDVIIQTVRSHLIARRKQDVCARVIIHSQVRGCELHFHTNISAINTVTLCLTHSCRKRFSRGCKRNTNTD